MVCYAFACSPSSYRAAAPRRMPGTLLVAEVAFGGQCVIIERRGKPSLPW
jgi:hypothetical protein